MFTGLTGNVSVDDLGCGLGQYVHWQGHDGAENIEEVTNGRGKFAESVTINPVEWSMSIEVAEHVPVYEIFLCLFKFCVNVATKLRQNDLQKGYAALK